MIVPAEKYKRFLRLWFAVVLAFLGVTALFNCLVDPYGLFDTSRIENFNAIKPAAGTHVRLAKPYQVIGFNPRTVIGGNSRPELGLDPNNGCWPTELRPIFNLGLPGAGTYMQARALQHAIADKEVELVLWGVDFLDFLNVHAKGYDPGKWPQKRAAFENRFKINADGSQNQIYSLNKLQDQLYALFSLDTMKDSLQTILEQRNHNASSIRRDGFNPARDYLDMIAWEGQGVLFSQKNKSLAKMFARPELRLFQEESHWSEEYESVRQFLKFVQKYKVRVVLFINPYHVDYLSLLELSGRWPAFELWKRKLTSLAGEFNVELWDFSEINSFTTEKAPVLGDKTKTLKWFWEPAHYRREYGDLMLSRILKRTCGNGGSEPVGNLLSDKNIDDHLNSLRQSMVHYKERHIDTIEQMRALHPGFSEK